MTFNSQISLGLDVVCFDTLLPITVLNTHAANITFFTYVFPVNKNDFSFLITVVFFIIPFRTPLNIVGVTWKIAFFGRGLFSKQVCLKIILALQ